jgi:hypothetical protein
VTADYRERIKGEMRRKELWDLILFEVTNDM